MRHPLADGLGPGRSFVLVRTAAAACAMCVGPCASRPALSGGLASPAGLSIEAERRRNHGASSLGETRSGAGLMMRGVPPDLKDLERLAGQRRSPLVQSQGGPGSGCVRADSPPTPKSSAGLDPPLSSDDALRLTATKAKTLHALPVHRFTPATAARGCWSIHPTRRLPIPCPAPEGFCRQLRPNQERAWAWLALLHRFDHGACLADDMAWARTSQAAGLPAAPQVRAGTEADRC